MLGFRRIVDFALMSAILAILAIALICVHPRNLRPKVLLSFAFLRVLCGKSFCLSDARDPLRQPSAP